MCDMSRASEIARNVWLGPTPDIGPEGHHTGNLSGWKYDLLVEATDLAQLSAPPPLNSARSIIGTTDEPRSLEFPSSGSIVPSDWTDADTEKLVDNCRWLYALANPDRCHAIEPQADLDGDVPMAVDPPPARKILIHCMDGYTETSFLALAYFMFVEGVPVHEAWLRLHRDRQRNFFAYPTDVSVLLHVQERILRASPVRVPSLPLESSPRWLSLMDGSFPSRIQPYLYLGNLGHANNPGLLRALGIGQVLSVGECLGWSRTEREEWTGETLHIDQVLDNGIDPLMGDFSRCLDFIGMSLIRRGVNALAHSSSSERKGEWHGDAGTLPCWRLTIGHHLHRRSHEEFGTVVPSCLVRSPLRPLPIHRSIPLTPSSSCFVRARRLNVIIQPHLRFS